MVEVQHQQREDEVVANGALDLGGEATESGATGLDAGMVVVGGDAEVRHVLSHPDVFSSGIDAVAIGQVRPLIAMVVEHAEGLARADGVAVQVGKHLLASLKADVEARYAERNQ